MWPLVGGGCYKRGPTVLTYYWRRLFSNIHQFCSDYQDEGDEDVHIEEEEVVCEEDTSREKEEPVPGGSSEEIEEQILEEQSEESEQEG